MINEGDYFNKRKKKTSSELGSGKVTQPGVKKPPLAENTVSLDAPVRRLTIPIEILAAQRKSNLMS